MSNAAFHCIKTSPKKLLPLTLFGIAVTSFFSVQPAQAYAVTLEQMGSNVVATGSGPINLTGLTFGGSLGNIPAIFAFAGLINTGPSALIDVYYGFVGPASFGSGFAVPNTTSGDFVGIVGGNGGLLSVPHGYVSGNPLSDSATYHGRFLGGQGVIPGTYTWTWGTGLPNQNFTLRIGAVPDGGSTVSLLGCALLGLAALRRKLGC